MSDSLASATLFPGIMAKLETRFRTIADNAQDELEAAARLYLQRIRTTFDYIREENVETENQRDLDYSDRVQEALALANTKIWAVHQKLGIETQS